VAADVRGPGAWCSVNYEEVAWFLHQLSTLSAGIMDSSERATEAGRDLRDLYTRPEGGSRASASPIAERIETEARHLLVDVADVWKIAKVVKSMTGHHTIRDSMDAFKADAQDALDFRDFYEHADAYIREAGNLSEFARWPHDTEVDFDQDGQITFVVRGSPDRFVSLAAAAHSGLSLASTVTKVLAKVLADLGSKSEANKEAVFRAALASLNPSARDSLRSALIHDQAERDSIAARLMRYRDERGDDWADIIDMLTMYPEERRRVVRLLAEIDAAD
jgi:hypothetical protein